MELNCRDFERLINEQLDAREAAAPDVERALAGHQAACPACRSMALRYQTLGQAIAAMTLHPPLPPAEFAARFRRGLEEPRCSPFDDAKERPILALPAGLRADRRSRRPAARRLDRTCVRGSRPPPVRPAAPPPPARPIDPDALSNALAEATSATWDLARATSAPAARVGLEVLDAAAQTETTAALSLPDEVGSTEERLAGRRPACQRGSRPSLGNRPPRIRFSAWKQWWLAIPRPELDLWEFRRCPW